MAYILDGKCSKDKFEAHKLKSKAAQYCIFGGQLYKDLFLGPLLRCIGQGSALKVMAENHEGFYRNHLGGRSLAKKDNSTGIFWPTMVKNSKRYARECEKCQ